MERRTLTPWAQLGAHVRAAGLCERDLDRLLTAEGALSEEGRAAVRELAIRLVPAEEHLHAGGLTAIAQARFWNGLDPLLGELPEGVERAQAAFTAAQSRKRGLLPQPLYLHPGLGALIADPHEGPLHRRQFAHLLLARLFERLDVPAASEAWEAVHDLRPRPSRRNDGISTAAPQAARQPDRDSRGKHAERSALPTAWLITPDGAAGTEGAGGFLGSLGLLALLAMHADRPRPGQPEDQAYPWPHAKRLRVALEGVERAPNPGMPRVETLRLEILHGYGYTREGPRPATEVRLFWAARAPAGREEGWWVPAAEPLP